MLTHLSLAEEDLKDAGWRHIWNAPGHFMCPLQRLVLRECSLTSACCKYMMSSFKNNQSLPSLALNFNRLMDNEVILLCRALADANCNLLVLELAQCWFTSASCHALTLAVVFFSQRRAEEAMLKKKSNDSVGVYTRLQGPKFHQTVEITGLISTLETGNEEKEITVEENGPWSQPEVRERK
ncbi:NACHT, LRR and PYD domains-containing protein 8 [Microtus ochrogaster]|uniref:NACHT, LRR and PYD domains-containing protein 8 n=1 Tax=Microtus ochrogaster TaxID=79684 RepID=A0A8J6GSU8_MICOH|nr:NACHT, LRR and PYD domains-containing protein 8 [Microtus ochrogaster]